MVWSIVKDIFLICVAGGIGLYFFKHFNPFLKAHTIQVLLALITYGGARAITSYQMHYQIAPNNQWVYNVYILFEGLLLYYAAYGYFNNSRLRKMVVIFTTIFLIVYVVQLSIQGYGQFANYAFITEGVLALVIYLIIMYQSVNLESTTKKIRPEFWISLGLSLYFACNAPYFGFIHYLGNLSPELNEKLFIFITDTLTHIRYLLAAIGLYLGAVYHRQAVIYE